MARQSSGDACPRQAVESKKLTAPVSKAVEASAGASRGWLTARPSPLATRLEWTSPTARSSLGLRIKRGDRQRELQRQHAVAPDRDVSVGERVFRRKPAR